MHGETLKLPLMFPANVFHVVAEASSGSYKYLGFMCEHNCTIGEKMVATSQFTIAHSIHAYHLSG